jgi:hypothetical protein
MRLTRTFADVVRVTAHLPEAEESTSYGTPAPFGPRRPQTDPRGTFKLTPPSATFPHIA